MSLAGRVTLVQSVTSAIPAYAMQTANLPISVCDEVEKANRRFIWGDTNSHKKVHLVAWDKICINKKGGLGLRHVKDQNAAFMTKLGWGLIKQKDALWTQVLRHKYKCGTGIMPVVKAGADASRLWKSIAKNWSHVEEGSIWRVGKGHDVKFWNDVWVPGC